MLWFGHVPVISTVQTVQKTLTSAQFWVGRRHARWCANDRALVRQWRKLVPQLQFFAGRHPDPHGPDQQIIEITVAFRIWWLMSLVYWPRRFSGASVEETVVSHSCSC